MTVVDRAVVAGPVAELVVVAELVALDLDVLPAAVELVAEHVTRAPARPGALVVAMRLADRGGGAGVTRPGPELAVRAAVRAHDHAACRGVMRQRSRTARLQRRSRVGL